MKLSKLKVCRLLILLTGVILLCVGSKRAEAAEYDTICDGVYIDDVNVSGMTREEAQEAVNAYLDGLMEKEIAVVLDEEVAITSVKDLGYACNENTYLDEAMNVGKIGNLIKRYKDLKDVENGGLYFELQFTLDESAVRNFIETQCSVHDIEAQNATVQRSGGQFVYANEIAGRKLDVDATYQAISNAILNDWNQLDIVVDAVIVDDIPQYTLEMVQKCNTLLGSFNTNYSTSSTSRKNNIANAARLINNSIVYPGEVFSCYEKMNPFTAENGYYSAGAYVNGMVEDSIGGGVCQASTTLYNAVLRAELEIVERAAHSMTVSYVPVSFDAAIAGTYKDLKFRNNLEVPVLVEAITNGTTITFNIYGYETRDTANRKVEYKSEIISKTEPPKDVITEDPTQPTTYRKVTQGAYTGYVAVLYKYVYENGVLVDTIQVNKSTYKASPAYVTVGTKEEEVPEEDDNDKEQGDKEDAADEDKNSSSTKPDSNKPNNNKPNNNETDTDKTDDKTENNNTENDKADESSDDSENDTTSNESAETTSDGVDEE